MRKKKQNWLIGLVVVLFLGFFIFPVLGPYLYPPLGTEYSEKFDKDIFDKIATGEKKSIVDSLLGKPLREHIDNSNEDSIKINYWYSNKTSSFLEYEKIIIQFYDNKVYYKICVLDGD